MGCSGFDLNSFKFMQQAIDYEVRGQFDQMEDGHTTQQAPVIGIQLDLLIVHINDNTFSKSAARHVLVSLWHKGAMSMPSSKPKASSR